MRERAFVLGTIGAEEEMIGKIRILGGPGEGKHDGCKGEASLTVLFGETGYCALEELEGRH